MEIEFSSHFLRQVRKISRTEQRLLSKKIEVFRKDPYTPSLKTHPLTGKLKGIFAFSLTHSKRVSFTFPTKSTALFLDIGSHDQVYR